MKQKLQISFFSVMFSFCSAYAQKSTEVKKDSVTRNTTTTIIITQENAQTYFPKKNVNQKNAIKLNPILALNGDLPIYFERVISDKISFEIGAGPTVQNFVQNFLDNDMEEVQDLDDERTYSYGYSFMADLRFYPADNSYALDGFYFSPEFRHRLYNSTIIEVGETELEQSLDRQTKITDVKVMFGKMDFIDDNIFLDYYLGTGIRNKMIETYDIKSAYGDPLVILPKTDRKSGITFSLGVKVGFAF